MRLLKKRRRSARHWLDMGFLGKAMSGRTCILSTALESAQKLAHVKSGMNGDILVRLTAVQTPMIVAWLLNGTLLYSVCCYDMV